MATPGMIRTLDVIRWAASGLSTLLYPSLCRVCGVELAAFEGPYFCEGCGASITPASVKGDVANYRVAPSYLPSDVPAYACFLYEGAAEAAVRLLKYDGKTVLARTMGDAVGALLEMFGGYSGFDAAAAVPLYPRRCRERGFNQARLIARRATKTSNVTLAYDGAVRRARDTAPQVTLSGEARLFNIAGAFVANPAFFAGRRVALVDDVITTGATIRACAQAIEDAGGTVAAAVAFAAPGVTEVAESQFE
jgi:predicted amidophosphoribosyltransferase